MFDTQGRLQRTANPPAPLPDANHRYVVVHKGDVLVETTNDVVDARFLDQTPELRAAFTQFKRESLEALARAPHAPGFGSLSF